MAMTRALFRRIMRLSWTAHMHPDKNTRRRAMRALNKLQKSVPEVRREIEVRQPEGSTMNQLRQHIPSFCEGFESSTASFATLDDLRAIPWVASFANLPAFHKFSQDDGILIAEYRGGREWWVVGRLLKPVEGLPQWNHGIQEVWIDGEAREVPGREVASVCGDEVVLKDGRKVRARRHS